MRDLTQNADRMEWLKGWPRMGPAAVLIGTGVHCLGCGDLRGITSVVIDEHWTPPAELPSWPFRVGDCPVCIAELSTNPVRDVRVSDLRADDEWLLGGAWVRVVNVVVRHPDDRVAITYEQDGETVTTREHRGSERAAVR